MWSMWKFVEVFVYYVKWACHTLTAIFSSLDIDQEAEPLLYPCGNLKRDTLSKVMSENGRCRFLNGIDIFFAVFKCYLCI